MTGHAFQVFVTDDELRSALHAVRAALTDDGRFVFETRNPAARAWEQWTPDNATEITAAPDTRVRVEHEVHEVVGELVRFTQTYTSPDWPEPEVSWSTLRFLDLPGLATFLADAGLGIARQSGDWDGGPLTPTSPEIITVAVPRVTLR
ncbi:hypothetical protein FHS29_002626 [Saccharothrix tamanrassetensis]|uniref:Methyltransferase n=1 Tax=Saccharothrix tamanrassetensis TaxID=1051531 RepID=A0A841CJ58_9PSEU|nr:hypothetical protein [Saccharothrix tamanrassetensis]MBB5956045.1 hypothetical protein [Saccharothrix tamanrassetensis]